MLQIDPLTALSEQIAADLLRTGAVAFSPDNPFTWASGLRAPIYCDNRVTLAFPSVRARISAGYEEVLGRGGYVPEAIAGVATAGIPQATLVAERRSLPLSYVRSQPKGHGRGNQVEGKTEKGQRVAVVEDLISTGGSAVEAVEALREAGTTPIVVVATFSYGLDAAAKRFAEADVPLATLTDFETLLRVAERAGAGDLAPDALATLRAWQQDPAAWSEQHGG